MRISNISFGKKIPISKCQIIDKKTNTTHTATIYEHDGKDAQDISYFKKLPPIWEFKPDLMSDIELKFIHQEHFKYMHIYSVENEKGQVIGIAEVSDNEKQLQSNLDYLETNHADYKYAGLDLMACIAREAIKKGYKKFVVPDPYDTARMFYVEHCGFDDIKGLHELRMDSKKIEELAQKAK